VDVYIGPHKFSTRVFVVNQVDPSTGKFDELKCMLGFESPEEAKEAYLGQYDSPKFFGSMVEMDMATFKDKLKLGLGSKKLNKSTFVELGKAGKYLKRWRGPDGKWRYAYVAASQRPAKTEDVRGKQYVQDQPESLTERSIQKVLKAYRRRAPGDGKEKTIANAAELDVLLKRSVFCLMSAGRNPEDPEDMKLTDAQIKQRYSSLLGDLKDKGYVFTRCRGKYGAPEESIMVMTHL